MEQSDLAAELGIRTLVARYAEAVTRNDGNAFGATWAENGEWRILGRIVTGREQVVEHWRHLVSTFSFVSQIAHGGIIEVSGAEATGRWTITEYLRQTDGTPVMNLGMYQDQYACVGDDWFFFRRRFEPLYLGPPDFSAAPIPLPDDF
ncbi:nuclear transport factor 2 family protein [Myxococcota bacterium]|nr:nuclear transport factor 2 family protein [Myxococcota bacterium]